MLGCGGHHNTDIEPKPQNPALHFQISTVLAVYTDCPLEFSSEEALCDLLLCVLSPAWPYSSARFDGSSPCREATRTVVVAVTTLASPSFLILRAMRSQPTLPPGLRKAFTLQLSVPEGGKTSENALREISLEKC